MRWGDASLHGVVPAMAQTVKLLRCRTCGKTYKVKADDAEPVRFCPVCNESLAPSPDPKTAGPLAPGAMLGPYEIVSEIARGGRSH